MDLLSKILAILVFVLVLGIMISGIVLFFFTAEPEQVANEVVTIIIALTILIGFVWSWDKLFPKK